MCLLAIRRDAAPVCFTFGGLELRALAAGQSVPLALFGHGHLAANLVDLLALRRHEPQQLRALRFRGGTGSVRGVPRLFCDTNGVVSERRALAQLDDALAQALQLVVPRLHLALRERDLEREAAAAEVRIAFCALPLPRERPHLALDFGDEIVEPLKIDGRLLESALGSAAPVTLQT